jgi:hypothetical protein
VVIPTAKDLGWTQNFPPVALTHQNIAEITYGRVRMVLHELLQTLPTTVLGNRPSLPRAPLASPSVESPIELCGQT